MRLLCQKGKVKKFFIFEEKRERNGGDLRVGMLDMAMKGEAAHHVGFHVSARMVVVVVKSWRKLTSDLMVDHSGIAFLSVWGSIKALDDKLGWCPVMSTVLNTEFRGWFAVEIYSHVKMMTLSRKYI